MKIKAFHLIKTFLKNLTIERKTDTMLQPEFIIFKHVLPDR